IVTTFRDLRSTLDTLSSSSLLQNVAASVQQHLNGVRRYASAQAICVQFMKNRIVDAEMKRHKARVELDAYVSLGANALSDDLEGQITDLSARIDEDEQCLAALQRRDTDVRAQFEALVAGELHHAKEAANLSWDPQVVNDVRHIFGKIFAVYSQKCRASSTSSRSKSWDTVEESVKSLNEIQTDELEDQITRDNLARLENGQRPTRSSELDTMRLKH
ncbi:hypothetical protein DYB31_012568, partial [Aphanomyces astaci]